MRPAFHMLEIEDLFSGFICCCHTPAFVVSQESCGPGEFPCIALVSVVRYHMYRRSCRPYNARRYVRLSGVKRFDALSGCFRLVVLPPSLTLLAVRYRANYR